MTKENSLKVLVAISILFSGATSLINEFILSSLSSMIVGNSFVMIMLTIGIMLFGTGFGSLAQGLISERYLMKKFMRLELTLTIVGGFSPLLIYFLSAYFDSQFTIALDLSIFFLGFLIGFEIPLLIRVIQSFNAELKTSLSIIFSSDYFGAFLGTLLWVYYLLPNYTFTEVGFIVVATNLMFASITYIFYLRNREYFENLSFENKKTSLNEEIVILKALGKNSLPEEAILRDLEIEENKESLFIFLLKVIFVYILLAVGFHYNKDIVIHLEQKLYKDRIVVNETTKYQHLVLTHNKNIDDYSLYINGSLQFSSKDKDRYHDLLVHPAVKIFNPSKVLIIGGGDGLVAHELQKYKNIEISLVDLDPDMIKLSQSNKHLRALNHGAFDNINVIDTSGVSLGALSIEKDKNTDEVYSRVNLYHIDASKFMMSIKNKQWDLIIVDLPDPSSPELTKLYSKQFYTSIRSSLTSNGGIVIQSTSPYHAKESFLMIGRTIRAAGFNNVLPYHINVPSFGDWGFHIAAKSNLNLKEEFLKIENFDVSLTYLNKDILQSSLAFGVNELTTEDERINEVTYPVLLDVYQNNPWLAM